MKEIGLSYKDPLVSVVIPVYNVEKYLRQCVETVIHQTYRNLDILLIDDGSTDGSGNICEEYTRRDTRIRVIHTDNNGLATARNVGIQNARGIYLSLIDSDDWLEFYMIEMMLNKAIQVDADIVAARACYEFVGKTINRADKQQTQIFHGGEILTAFVDGEIGDVVWNKIYRSSCFEGIRYPDGYNYEDVFTTWKIMKRLAEKGGTVITLPDELFHFRFRNGSITHVRSYKNTVDGWMAYKEKYEVFPEYQEKLLQSCYIAIGKMWVNYSGFSNEEKVKAVKEIQEMHLFAKEHFRQVITGKYSIRVKITAIFAMSTSPLLMWFCYKANRARTRIKQTIFQYFD